MSFIPCAAWIRQGVAKEIPDKVTLSKDDLKRFIETGRAELEDLEVEEDLLSESDDSNVEDEGVVDATNGPEQRPNDEDGIEKYHLDNYDEEDESPNPLAGLAGLTLFSSNDEDPYITLKDDVDSDEEDFKIHPDDNLIAVGHVDNDSSAIEIYVYSNGHYYIHHDILLPSPVLCVEWLDFDPAESSPGNLIAVGSMSPTIEVYDVDLVDSLEPVFKLGQRAKKKKKKSEV